MSCLAVVD
jgi:hypothetical protein